MCVEHYNLNAPMCNFASRLLFCLFRRLFDKALACKLSSKKMKFIFKKYLEFEKRHGDETTVESVKKMAEEYVQEKAS